MKLDGGPAANIEPLLIRLKPGAVPVRAKQRRYPPGKRKFMRSLVRQLLMPGFVRKVSCPE